MGSTYLEIKLYKELLQFSDLKSMHAYVYISIEVPYWQHTFIRLQRRGIFNCCINGNHLQMSMSSIEYDIAKYNGKHECFMLLLNLGVLILLTSCCSCTPFSYCFLGFNFALHSKLKNRFTCELKYIIILYTLSVGNYLSCFEPNE